MAASHLNKSARLNQTRSTTNCQSLRINLGVVTIRRAPDHLGWRLVTSAVRRYRTLSPEAQSLLRAFAVALFLAAMFIRLVFLVEQ